VTPPFPFELLRWRGFEGPLGEALERVEALSMIPPFPWGIHMYGGLLETHCARLEGDVLEAGVGMGGTSIFLALLVKSLGLGKRVVGVDSFKGLPAPTSRDNGYFAEAEYGLAEDDPAGDLFESFWLTTAAFRVLDTLEPVQGFFDEALPLLDPTPLCFVHVDADLHGSVASALEHLYDRVVDGGVIAVDDFFHPAQGPARATTEFLAARGLRPTLHVVFPYGVFFFKGDNAGESARTHDGNVYSLQRLRADAIFRRAVEETSAGLDGRSARNAQAFAALLDSAPRYGDIYEYWRALEEWWEWIDRPSGSQGHFKLRDLSRRDR
jgi:SAM-dependent methyltransferase